MSNLSVADARRHEKIGKNRQKIERLSVELSRVAHGVQGIGNSYVEQRKEYLIGQQDHLKAEISRLEQLSGDDLVNEFAPVAAPAPDVDYRDTLRRGPMLPSTVDVHVSRRPGRHVGPEAGMAQPTVANSVYGPPKGWRPGVAMTTDENGNAVPAER